MGNMNICLCCFLCSGRIAIDHGDFFAPHKLRLPGCWVCSKPLHSTLKTLSLNMVLPPYKNIMA